MLQMPKRELKFKSAQLDAISLSLKVAFCVLNAKRSMPRTVKRRSDIGHTSRIARDSVL